MMPTIELRGTGRQSLTWEPRPGARAIAVTHADAGPGVSVTSEGGARAPVLGWVGAGPSLLAGLALLVAAMTPSRDEVASLPHPAVGGS